MIKWDYFGLFSLCDISLKLGRCFSFVVVFFLMQTSSIIVKGQVSGWFYDLKENSHLFLFLFYLGVHSQQCSGFIPGPGLYSYLPSELKFLIALHSNNLQHILKNYIGGVIKISYIICL